MLYTILKNKIIIRVLKFLIVFCFFYFGTLAIIGLSAPVGYYSPYVAQHLNFISWLRGSLLGTAKLALSLFNYRVYFEDDYVIRIQNGWAIRMVYSCVGYGIMSFWAAFILTNTAPGKRKFIWLIGGLLMIWCINVIRVCLVLVSYNNNWAMPFGIDHHTWFNIIAYLFVFLLIYFYDVLENKLTKPYINSS